MVYFQIQDQKTQVQDEKSESQSSFLYCYSIPLDCCSIPLERSEVTDQQKISKHKKPITCLFEAQITILFFPVFKGHYKLTLDRVFREKIVHLVPLIVNLGFCIQTSLKSST